MASRTLKVEEASCAVDGCARPAKSGRRGWCEMHYIRAYRHGSPGSSEPVRMSRHGVCAAEGCERYIYARGMCSAHYRRQRAHGDVRADMPVRLIGEGTVTRHGYRVVYRPGHSNTSDHGVILEHRLVMAEALGRPLLPGETVHHKNGDKLDNDLGNLELWAGRHGTGQRVDDLIADALDVLRRYAPEHLKGG